MNTPRVLLILICLSLGACMARSLPATPLFSGIPRDFNEANAALDVRIAARFPLGSPAADVGPWLETQGLTLKRHFVHEDGATYSQADVKHLFMPPMCDMRALVWWRGDPSGALTEIEVNYGDTGCL